MLLKMLPDQISKQWDTVKHAISSALPPEDVSENGMTEILNLLLRGNMQCWLMVDEDRVHALFTTMFFNDPCRVRSLFIYSLYAYEVVSLEMWKSAFDSLKVWARGNKCRYVIAYTENKRILEIVRSLGGNTSKVIVSLEV